MVNCYYLNNFLNHERFAIPHINHDLILLILFPLLIYYLSVASFMPNDYFGLNSTAMLFVSFGLNMIFAIIMYEKFERNLSNFLIGKYMNCNNYGNK